MPRSSPSSPGSLAARLRPLLRSRKARLTIGEMVDRIEGDGGLGPLLLVLTLPVLLPLPPGFSMVLALPLLLVAPQIVLGRREIWLPPFLARRTIKRPALVKLIGRVLPPLEQVETVVRPRLRFLTRGLG